MKQAGFTLPEVLIGLAVGAVAVLIAGAGVAAALKARSANLAASVAVEDIVAAVSLESRLLARATPVREQTPQPAGVPPKAGGSLLPAPASPASAFPAPAAPAPPPASAQQKPGYLFEGDASAVRFVTALWGDPGDPGLWHVTLRLAPSPGAADPDHARQHLVVAGHLYQQPTADPAQDARAGAPAQEDQVLAEGETGASARFAYAGRNDKGEIGWTSNWKPEDGWPALVSFDPDGDGPAPPTVVRLPDERAPSAPSAAMIPRPGTLATAPRPGAGP